MLVEDAITIRAARSDAASACLRAGAAAGRQPCAVPQARRQRVDREHEIVGGRYRLLRLLAMGGVGCVYEAEHLHTGARVALKLPIEGQAINPAARSRCRAEARLTACVESEHVVRILDAGVTDDRDASPFVAMELLHGNSLEEEASAPMSTAHVTEILGQVAQGISRAHAAGIIHCDLKPDNIFVSRSDEGALMVKLLDFGIARRLAPHDAAAMSDDGMLFGTPTYMAPEQGCMHNEQLGTWTDTWAIGLLAFRLLSGRSYFSNGQISRLLYQVSFGRMLPPSKMGCDVSPAFDRWFMRSCSRDIEQRFHSAIEQVRALQEVLENATAVVTDELAAGIPAAAKLAPTVFLCSGRASALRSVHALRRTRPASGSVRRLGPRPWFTRASRPMLKLPRRVDHRAAVQRAMC